MGGKKFFLQTFGCQMNVYDGQRISGMLGAMGLGRAESVADADIIILNTCSVREKATNKVFSALGRIRDAKKPSALFGIVGCAARESGADAFKRIPELNFVLGPQSYHKLPLVLENPDARHLCVDLSGLEKFDEMVPMAEAGPIAHIPIQEGCGHCCSYCIVPFTRGPELSRPFADVMSDAARAAGLGAVEICFLGQNVNGYAGGRLADLIRETAKLDGVKRIRYASSHPGEMTDDLIALHGSEPKLLPFLNLPLQSGSPEILRAMGRPYGIGEYMGIIARLRAARSDIQISSDFIVGFPGETDSDFEMTCAAAREAGFINSYSFKYSRRPHTAAAAIDRLQAMNSPSARVAAVRRAVIAQRLVRTLCAGCGGSGCDRCSGTGYYGRTVIAEIITVDTPLADRLSQGIPPESLRVLLNQQNHA
ncbi:MAG: MiaB/RimO family radical SAM methylthiotransferase, partial [Rickettsiales bacterium]|nr:MiaB/RimO family radical SAM methylthiotransferase [Rickettsiales bacterium]